MSKAPGRQIYSQIPSLGILPTSVFCIICAISNYIIMLYGFFFQVPKCSVKLSSVFLKGCPQDQALPGTAAKAARGKIQTICIKFPMYRTFSRTVPALGKIVGSAHVCLHLVKEESETAGFKLNVQETKIMASGPITSWKIDGETVETVTDFIFLGSKTTADGDCSHEIKRCLLLGRKTMTNLHSILKNRDITLPTKVHVVKALIFFSSHV